MQRTEFPHLFVASRRLQHEKYRFNLVKFDDTEKAVVLDCFPGRDRRICTPDRERIETTHGVSLWRA